MSQQELCLHAKMSQSFLANIEAGKKEPSVLTLIRIAEALHVTPRVFFPETQENDEINVKNKIKKEITELLEML